MAKDNGNDKHKVSPLGAAVAGAAAGALAGAAAVAMTDPKKRAAVQDKAKQMMDKGKGLVEGMKKNVEEKEKK